MVQCSSTTWNGILIDYTVTVYMLNDLFLNQVPQYHTLCKRYSYTPDENSMSIVGKLCPKTYVSKFHRLVYLDEIAHCLKMAQL